MKCVRFSLDKPAVKPNISLLQQREGRMSSKSKSSQALRRAAQQVPIDLPPAQIEPPTVPQMSGNVRECPVSPKNSPAQPTFDEQEEGPAEESAVANDPAA